MALTFSAWAPLAMRDVELHLLTFLQAAVAGTRDRAEYTNTSGPSQRQMKPSPMSPVNHFTVAHAAGWDLIPSATCPWKLCKRPSWLTQVYGRSPVRQRDSCRSFSERRAAGLTGENEHG